MSGAILVLKAADAERAKGTAARPEYRWDLDAFLASLPGDSPLASLTGPLTAWAADRACEALVVQHPGIRIGRWSGGDFEEITFWGPVTFWLDTMFAIDPAPPYLPIGVVQADGVHVVIRSVFKLAAKSRSEPRLRSAWESLRAEGHADVPSVGAHLLRPDGWFVYEAPVVGSADAVASEVARVGSGVLDFLASEFV